MSRWIESVRNLEVRDALTQISDNWTLVIAGLSGLVLVVLAVAGVFRPSGVGSTLRDVKAFPLTGRFSLKVRESVFGNRGFVWFLWVFLFFSLFLWRRFGSRAVDQGFSLGS